MQVNCQQCGEPFEAKRSTAKYCSDKCRQRVQRRRNDPPPAAPVGLVATVRKELEQLGKSESYVGQQALIIAERMASAKETGSAVTSLSQELTRLMATAKAGAPAEEDEVARARRIRDEKRARAQAGEKAR